MSDRFFQRVAERPREDLLTRLNRLKPTERSREVERYQSLGILPPGDDGMLVEMGQGFASTAVSGLRGLGATANEHGLGSGMQDYFDGVLRRNRHWAEPDYLSTGSKITRIVGEAAGSTAVIAPGMIAGGAIGTAAGGPGIGTAIGAGIAAFGVSYGENIQNNRKLYGDKYSEGEIRALAAGESAIDAAIEAALGTVPGVGRALGRLSGGAKKRLVMEMLNDSAKQMGKSAARNFWIRTGQSALRNGAEEAAEEGLQYANQWMWRNFAGDKTAQFKMGELADAMGQGFIGGTALGLPFGGIGHRQQAGEAKIDSARQNSATAPGPAVATAARTAPEAAVKMAPGTVVQPETVAANQEIARPVPASAQLIEKVSGELGLKVRYFDEADAPAAQDARGNQVNGWYDDRAGEIWLDRSDSEVNPLETLGHEFKHFLNKRHPDLIESFDALLGSGINKEGRQAMAGTEADYAAAGYPDGQGAVEFNADTFGKMWTQPEFWQEVVAKAETMDAGMGKKFIDALTDFIKMIRSKLKEIGTPEAKQLFDNMAELRDSAAAALAEYKRRTGTSTEAENVVGVQGQHQVQSVPLSGLEVDPARFQFKSKADKITGVDSGNQIGGKWDPITAGNLYVWEDADGRKFVVNGHHRFQLANENQVEAVNAIVDRETDGVTAEQARRNGILINIRDGQGDVIDYAQFVRGENMSEETARHEGILAREKGRLGFQIGRYAGDNLFDLYRSGNISDAKAAAVAEIARGDEATEAAGIRAARTMPAGQLKEFLKLLSKTPRQQNVQGDLFGFDDSAIRTAEILSKLAARHIAEIADKVRAVRQAVKNPDAAAKGDVKVGRNAEKRLQKTLQEQQAWENWHTDTELYSQLLHEAGLDQQVSSEQTVEAPNKSSEQTVDPGRFENPVAPLLSTAEDAGDFQLVGETAEEQEARRAEEERSEAREAQEAQRRAAEAAPELFEDSAPAAVVPKNFDGWLEEFEGELNALASEEERARIPGLVQEFERFRPIFGKKETTKRMEREKVRALNRLVAPEMSGAVDYSLKREQEVAGVKVGEIPPDMPGPENLKNLRNWLKEYYHGTPRPVNADKGWSISVPATGLKETLNHLYRNRGGYPRDLHYRTLPYIAEMLEKAKFDHDADVEAGKSGDRISYFNVPVQFEGEGAYNARMVVKHFGEDKNYYDHKLTEFEALPDPRLLSEDSGRLNNASDVIIPPDSPDVKSENEYSLKRKHRQVNPIREPGEVQDQHQDRLQVPYEPKNNATLNSQAAEHIVRFGGLDGTIKALLDGDFAIGSDVAQRAAQVVLNSDAYRTLAPESRAKIADMYIKAGYNAGSALAARRLGLLDMDSIDSIQAHVNAILAKIDQAKPGNDVRQEIIDRYDIDPGQLPPEIVNNPKQLDRLLRAMAAERASKLDKAYEWWINSILSAPQTHAANTLGNTANAVYELGVKRLAEATVNIAARRKDAATFGEFREMTKALDWRNAWERAKLSFDQEALTPEGKIEIARTAIGGKLGRAVRVPGRFLRAADEFAKALLAPAEASAFAYREGKAAGFDGAELSAYIQEQLANEKSAASDYGRLRALELTFQEDPGVAVKQLVRWREAGGVGGTLLKFFLPFIKTPHNILRQGVRKSPVGSLSLAWETGKGLLGKREFNNDYIQRVAEQVVAWSTVALFMGLDDDDERPFITGTSPAYGSAEARFKANIAPPYSIRIGDTYYSYKRLEPLATGLAFIADGLEAMRHARNGVDGTRITKNLLEGVKQLVVEKSFLDSIGEISRFASDPERSAMNFSTNFAASWMPNAVRQGISLFDDNVRDNRTRSRGLEWWKDQFWLTTNRAGITRAAPRLDYFGREIPKDSLVDAGALWPLMRMIPIQPVKPDANMNQAEELIWRYNQDHPDSEYYPDVPAYYFQRGGQKLYFNNEQYQDFARDAGQLALKQINAAIRSGQLNVRKPTERDIELIKKIFTQARKEVRDRMYGKGEYSE